MSIIKQPKKKISVAISQHNIDKIDKIIRENPEENTSSVINHSLDISLEEIAELLQYPLKLEEELTKRKLEDIQRKLKEEKKE